MLERKFLALSGSLGINFSFLSGLFVFGHKFLFLSGPLGINFSFLSGLFVFGCKLLASSGSPTLG